MGESKLNRQQSEKERPTDYKITILWFFPCLSFFSSFPTFFTALFRLKKNNKRVRGESGGTSLGGTANQTIFFSSRLLNSTNSLQQKRRNFYFSFFVL